MIKGTINGTNVKVLVEGSAEELAKDVLRLTRAIYDSIIVEDGPLKLNALSFKYAIVANINHQFKRKEE